MKLFELCYTFKWWFWRIKTFLFYKFFFGSIGKRSVICKPMYIAHPENMYLGNHVRLREFARVETITNYNGVSFKPKLIIDDDTGIEQGCHITCAESISIGKGCAITSYVTITDINHTYEDMSILPVDQKLSTKPVKIGDYCLIGSGTVILPGSEVGDHCIVAANAVLTGKTYPPYSLIGGYQPKL